MFLNVEPLIFLMQGRTKCPYCGKNVVVEVPDGASGIQKAKCPNCGMIMKVDVREREDIEESPLHPLVKRKPTKMPVIAGILLIVAALLGISMGAALLLSENEALHGSGMYEGMVTDGEGKPLEGAEIYVMEGKDIEKVAETDENGYFHIENLSAGKHRIMVKKEGYVTKNVTIGVFPFKSFLKEKIVLNSGEGWENKKALSAWVFDILPVFSAAIIILSIPPLIGGIFALMKKFEIVAIIGAIFGIFSIGFIIGSILSIVALILLLLSKEDFRA